MDAKRFKKILVNFGIISLIMSGMIIIYSYYLSGLRIESAQYKIDWRAHPVIVFESDDWGASRLFYDARSMKKGKEILTHKWEEEYSKYMYSTLESEHDMKNLFSVLKNHKGADKLPVVFTANYVMCSPDYIKIMESRYKQFFSICLPDVPINWKRGDFIAIAQEGERIGVWAPEYHGMLHANKYKWMELLNSQDNSTRQLFDLESYAGMNGENGPEYDPNLKIDRQRVLIKEGIEKFKEVFGAAPTSSISPFYVWQQETEEILSRQGVRVIQAKNLQTLKGKNFIDTFMGKVMGKVLNIAGYRSSNKHWQIRMGDSNAKTGITYLLRNVKFEPMVLKESEDIDKVVETVLQLWKANQPVVVSTHRFNYVSLDSRKEYYIRLLDELLTRIESARPDVVYLTDSELSQLFDRGYSVRNIGNMTVIRNFSDKPKSVHVEVPIGMKVEDISMIHQMQFLPIKNFDISNLSILPHTNVIVRFHSYNHARQIIKSNNKKNFNTIN